MKRVLSIALILCMILSLFAPSAFAADDKAKAAAEELHGLGLLNGSGINADGSINYDLDSILTRDYGIVMLVRMIGKEDEAKAGSWTHPFSDVAPWLEPYVGYAYASKLTTGMADPVTGEPVFGSKVNMKATEYLTFVLRALGYSSGTDFRWDRAWELTDKLGITDGEYNESNNASFTRGDMAVVSLSARQKSAEPPVMTANVSGKNYQIDENGNLTVTGRTLYLSDINIAGDVTIPAGMSYRRVILENVNIGGTIRVQNANTTLWTNGRAAGVTVSAALCSITVRDGVRVTEADGAQETIINKASSQPLYAAAMSDNGDLTGIPDGRGFSLALVSGEDILNLAGWSSRRAGETVNICSTLLGRGATEPGFGRLRLDKALLFGTVPTSYASRYSLGAMKTLNAEAVSVVEGGPVRISAEKVEATEEEAALGNPGVCLVRAAAPDELNANASYWICRGDFVYEKASGGYSHTDALTAAELTEGVRVGAAPGRTVFIAGWYVNAAGELVLVDGYSAGVKTAE